MSGFCSARYRNAMASFIAQHLSKRSLLHNALFILKFSPTLLA